MKFFKCVKSRIYSAAPRRSRRFDETYADKDLMPFEPRWLDSILSKALRGLQDKDLRGLTYDTEPRPISGSKCQLDGTAAELESQIGKPKPMANSGHLSA